MHVQTADDCVSSPAYVNVESVLSFGTISAVSGVLRYGWPKRQYVKESWPVTIQFLYTATRAAYRRLASGTTITKNSITITNRAHEPAVWTQKRN
jgi:hypothetical protein